MKRSSLAVLAAALALALPASLPADAAQPACGAPTGTVALGTGLPVTVQAIRNGLNVVIVAIGSSSTSGVGASSPAFAYPAVLAGELRRRWPGLGVSVFNRGVGGETAAQTLARFDRDVAPLRPHLVIWQTGSNTALKDGDPDGFATAVRAGVRRLQSWRADVVLMDPQYAPRVIARPTHRRIVDAIAAVARDHQVALFHRFAATRQWMASADPAAGVIASDRLHMNDRGYGCIARLLADALDGAALAAPPAAMAAVPTGQ